jgi:hypothetical protein
VIIGNTQGETHRLQCPGSAFVTRIYGQHGLIGSYRTKPEIYQLCFECSDGSIHSFGDTDDIEDDSASFSFSSPDGITDISGTLALEDKRWFEWVRSSDRTKWPSTLKVGNEKTGEEPVESETFHFACIGKSKLTGVFVTAGDNRIGALQFHCGDCEQTSQASSSATAQDLVPANSTVASDVSASTASSSISPLISSSKATGSESESQSITAAAVSAVANVVGSVAARCGQPKPWNVIFQEEERWFYDVTSMIILVFAFCILMYVIFRSIR